MDFNIGPMTDAFLNECSKELKKKETKDKFINIVTPLMNDISSQYQSYFLLLITILVLIISLLIAIIIILIKKQ